MAISMQFFSKPYSGQSNQDILDTLEDILAQGSSCETPVYASLCEIQQILDKLDEGVD